MPDERCEVFGLSIFEAYRRGWLDDGARFAYYVPTWAGSFADRLKEQAEGHVIEGHSYGDAVALTLPRGLGADLVYLDWTQPYFGGERPWFLCPMESCGRRCGVLYLTSEGMRCRVCAGVTYETQRERQPMRAWRRAQRIRSRLATIEWATDPDHTTDIPPPRPLGMHQTTYDRLLRDWIEYTSIWTESFYSDALSQVGRVARCEQRSGLRGA